MEIVQFQRKPPPGAFSLESHFAAVRSELKLQGVSVEPQECPYFSRGVLPRVRNMRWAASRQGVVNHIAGDVHFLAPALDRRRTILTICDLTILDYYSGLKRRAIKYFWYDWPIRNAEYITVISESTRSLLVKQFPSLEASRVRVIPVSVSPDFVVSPKRFDERCPRILQIGTNRQKNIERLAAALAGLNCHLHIVGRLSESQKSVLQACCVNYTNEYGVSDARILEAYQQCDVVSFPSTSEGFGMPIVEAQCVERPVLTSNCSSMPEVAGDGACLVDPFSVQSIREGFQRILGDSGYRDKLIRAGAVNRERFSLSSVAAEYAKLYKEVHETNLR